MAAIPTDGSDGIILCRHIDDIVSGNAPALEVVALNTRDLGEAFALALTGMFSDWRAAAQVTTIATRCLTITAKRTIPALLDGERVTLQRGAEIRFVPAAFRALVPEGSPILGASPGHHA